MPKDVVSGDFYWLSKTETHLFLAVGDCTGHGVPGAFMSMLGFAYLNEIVNRNPEYAANDILNSLRQKVTYSLHQNSQSISKDGIDMSLIIINSKTKELQYSGANNPIVICRNHALTYLHPDKMPIGIHFTETEEPFSLKRFELQKNDTLYLFTDGYVDQYGGEGLKKIGRNNFNNLLLEASSMNIEMQKFYLEDRLIEWKKDVEQMDDILVVGIKI
jgi:serine phosphatase RsbU (regulator of sigma subunit)